MSNRISEQWQDFYLEIADFVVLADAEAAEVEQLEESVQKLFDDQFVLTSSPQAIRRREKILGIQADPANESLDFRKKRILNRYQTKPPFTIRHLQQRLDFLFGSEHATVEVDVQNFILKVQVFLEDASFLELERTVHNIKPANLIYQPVIASPQQAILVAASARSFEVDYLLCGTFYPEDDLEGRIFREAVAITESTRAHTVDYPLTNTFYSVPE